MRRHLLVTGGAGFIGSNFIHYVLRERPDWVVTNLDKLTYAGNLENLRAVERDPRYRFVQGDICDRHLADALFRGDSGLGPVDAVVNFAAESHVDRSILDPSPFIHTNVQGTQVLLEAARTAWQGWLAGGENGGGWSDASAGAPERPAPVFIQISTDEVYGSLAPGDSPFTERSPLLPNSPYAASKAAADLLCRAYHRTFGLPVIVTRCCNNYGPYQFPEKLIPLFVTNALEDQPLPLYGDGLNVRDWIYVEDHSAAVLSVIERGRPGEVYNVGSGCEVSNLDMTRAILRILGKPESLIRHVADRPGHDRRYAIDASRLRSELGWSPRYRFEEALEHTVRWYAENRGWWERVRSGEYRRFYEMQYGTRFLHP